MVPTYQMASLRALVRTRATRSNSSSRPLVLNPESKDEQSNQVEDHTDAAPRAA
jgi:hypothetical protein